MKLRVRLSSQLPADQVSSRLHACVDEVRLSKFTTDAQISGKYVDGDERLVCAENILQSLGKKPFYDTDILWREPIVPRPNVYEADCPYYGLNRWNEWEDSDLQDVSYVNFRGVIRQANPMELDGRRVDVGGRSICQITETSQGRPFAKFKAMPMAFFGLGVYLISHELMQELRAGGFHHLRFEATEVVGHGFDIAADHPDLPLIELASDLTLQKMHPNIFVRNPLTGQSWNFDYERTVHTYGTRACPVRAMRYWCRDLRTLEPFDMAYSCEPLRFGGSPLDRKALVMSKRLYGTLCKYVSGLAAEPVFLEDG